MTVPRWDDASVKRGTKIRIALWLLERVGQGNTFTKAHLREAFPGVEQVDRRMRDLRKHEWVIATSADDPALGLNELRFVQAGEEVWKPGRAAPKEGTLSARQRAEILARDDYICVLCGIAAGDTYPDAAHQKAQLSVSRRGDGQGHTSFVSECSRCRDGGVPSEELSAASVVKELKDLSEDERQVVVGWIAADRRTPSAAERAWSRYRRLSGDEREDVAREIAG